MVIVLEILKVIVIVLAIVIVTVMDLIVVVAEKCEENIECNSNGSSNIECNCNRYCHNRGNSYSSDSSSKILNHDRKRNNHYHGTTPGSNSNKLEGALVS